MKKTLETIGVLCIALFLCCILWLVPDEDPEC